MANFAVKVSGRLGEPCFQAGISEANFAIKGSGRLGEPCFKAGDHTQD